MTRSSRRQPTCRLVDVKSRGNRGIRVLQPSFLSGFNRFRNWLTDRGLLTVSSAPRPPSQVRPPPRRWSGGQPVRFLSVLSGKSAYLDFTR